MANRSGDGAHSRVRCPTGVNITIVEHNSERSCARVVPSPRSGYCPRRHQGPEEASSPIGRSDRQSTSGTGAGIVAGDAIVCREPGRRSPPAGAGPRVGLPWNAIALAQPSAELGEASRPGKHSRRGRPRTALGGPRRLLVRLAVGTAMAGAEAPGTGRQVALVGAAIAVGEVVEAPGVRVDRSEFGRAR